MSVSKANSFYQELTPQQKHFVDNKTINTTLSLKHWISFLSKASAFDTYADKARTTLAIRIGWLSFLVIASVIATLAMEIYYILIATGILGIFLFSTIQARRHFVSRDINNYLRQFFMPFLETIRQKAGDDTKLSASLDFRDPLKVLTPTESEVTVAGRKRKIQLYEPKLVIAGITLSDNSYLETVLLDEITKISYRNANNKSKSKTKTLHRLFIRLSVSKNVYTRNGMTIPPHIEFSESTDQYIFKLKHKEKEQVYGVLTPGVFFGALSSLYEFLQPVQGTSTEGSSFLTPGTTPGLVPRMAEALIWNDVLFNNYDYDSVSRRGSGVEAGTDDSRNIFDS